MTGIEHFEVVIILAFNVGKLHALERQLTQVNEFVVITENIVKGPIVGEREVNDVGVSNCQRPISRFGQFASAHDHWRQVQITALQAYLQ